MDAACAAPLTRPIRSCTACTRATTSGSATGSRRKTRPKRLPRLAGTGSPRGRRSTGTKMRRSCGRSPCASRCAAQGAGGDGEQHIVDRDVERGREPLDQPQVDRVAPRRHLAGADPAAEPGARVAAGEDQATARSPRPARRTGPRRPPADAPRRSTSTPVTSATSCVPSVTRRTSPGRRGSAVGGRRTGSGPGGAGWSSVSDSSTPARAMPSAMQWCSRATTARPRAAGVPAPRRPAAARASRVMSSGRPSRSLTSAARPSSPAHSPPSTRWRSRSKSGSSVQTGCSNGDAGGQRPHRELGVGVEQGAATTSASRSRSTGSSSQQHTGDHHQVVRGVHAEPRGVDVGHPHRRRHW